MLTHINARSQTRTHARLQSVAALLWAGETPAVGNRLQGFSCETWNCISGWLFCSAWRWAVTLTANSMSYRGSCALQRGCWHPDKLLFRGQGTDAHQTEPRVQIKDTKHRSVLLVELNTSIQNLDLGLIKWSLCPVHLTAKFLPDRCTIFWQQNSFLLIKCFYGEIISITRKKPLFLLSRHLMPVPPVKQNRRLLQDGLVGDTGPVLRRQKNGFYFAFAVRQGAFQIFLIL